MLKNYWNRKTAYLALTATLVAGFTVTFVAPTAATICRELNLAGFSLSLDHYTEKTGSSIITSSMTASRNALTADAATAPAVTAPAEDQEQGDVRIGKRIKKKKRKATVRKQFQAKAISIAGDYVNIRKSPNTHSKIKGKLYEGSAANVIKTKKGWAKIESGEVIGYIKTSYLAIGADAQKVAEKYGKKLVSVNSGVVTLNVRKKKSTHATILTQIPEDEMYEVAHEGKNWAKIVVDEDTKGFVSKKYVKVHIRFKHAVSIREEREKRARERAARLAEQQRLAALNSARTSRSSGSSQGSAGSVGSSAGSGSSGVTHGQTAQATGSTGADIARYALNFVGNPYKWGGTSLTHGADCSGFVQSIYAQYGYSIPRTSREQSTYGKRISLSQVQPGDLIFYKHGSTVGHVAMYIGGGRVVHAATSTQGIITSNMNYNQPYCARRIV